MDEFSRREMEESSEETAGLFPKRRFCMSLPCFGTGRSAPSGGNWWHKMRAAENDEGWWSRGIGALKKLREWSEIAAGPRWKTFIRRFNRNRSGGGGGGKHSKFQYDPFSYALNFDEGPGQNGGDFDEEYGSRNFSTRYAAVPASGNSSTDVSEEFSRYS